MKTTKEIVKTTTNRSVFNRAYKLHLEKEWEIHCAYCPYHSGENFHPKKCYGGYDDSITYPSWKLATKNRKQWMEKRNIRYTSKISKYTGKTFHYIEFDG